MIPNVVFIVLKYVFLILLYIFILMVVRSVYRDARAPVEPGSAAKRKKKKKEHPQLVVLAADRNLGARYNLGDHTVIGRAEGSNIVIDDTYASQQHARVYIGDGAFFVEDLGSTNGTYVNGRRLAYPLELRQGDRIKIGKTVFEFRR